MYIRTHFFRLVLTALLLLTPLPAAADSFTQGVAAYKTGNYPVAARYFQNAVRENPQDPNRLFYLAMALTHMGKYDEARQGFEYVIQMVPPNHPLAQKARNNITVITKDQIAMASNSGKARQIMVASLSRNSKENYLTHVIPGGKVVHFAPEKMPLRVYIEDGRAIQGYTAGHKNVVNTAMRTWQNASGNKIRFVQSMSETDADIVVRWQRNFSDNILGVSPWQVVGDTLVKSDIHLATYYPDSNQPIPMAELQAIAIHEMGHAIGIKGHSPFPEDIMFYSKNARNSRLSQRDINTIRLLYNIEADIKNASDTSTTSLKRYYALYDAGYKAHTSGQITQAMNYYRQAMQISRTQPEAKYNLGALLINEGNRLARDNNLGQAQKYFQEAVQLFTELSQSPDPPEDTGENLNIARQNLNLINQHLSSARR